MQVDSPAYVSGIKSNDVIIAINGKKIESVMEVSLTINTSTKETVNILISRNSSEIEFVVNSKKTVKTQDNFGNQINKKIIGIKIAPPSEDINKKARPCNRNTLRN